MSVTNSNEFAIFFESDNSNTINILSELSAGTPVGIDVDAQDPDVSGGVSDLGITYSLANGISGDNYSGTEFAINSNTGEVLVGSTPPTYDAGGENTRTVYVMASSLDGSKAIQQFNVVVTDSD